jgi:hypothetical protein
MVDPIKDLMGEIMEIRAGLKLISKGLAERGINAEDIWRNRRMNDDRRPGPGARHRPASVTDGGILQAAAGYIAPKGAQTGE